jgi:chromosome segregation ATPase
MGLFINKQAHPNLYKNSRQLSESNQVVSRQDLLTEIMKEQQKANIALNQALAELQLRYQQQTDAQNTHWQQVDYQLNDLKHSSLRQHKFENEMVTNLHSLHEKNVQLEGMVEKETQARESLTKQISQISKTCDHIADRLEKNEETQQQLTQQMNEQLEMQKQAAEKLTKQEDVHGGILERLDHQDALLDKLARQLNHVRSILFERTNYLAGKIDEGYKLTSSYVYKLMSGSEQPLTFFLMNHKKEENQEKVD